MFRHIRSLLMTVAVVTIAFGTLSTSVHTKAADEKTLVIWTTPEIADDAASTANPVKGALGKYFVEQFQKEHPGVTVKIENHGWDEVLRQNLLTALMAGTGPDIVVGEAFFQQYADLGALVPVDDIVAANKDNLIEGTLAGAKSGGKYYGISLQTAVFGFERNCDLIKAAGLSCDKAPATWDELLTQVKTITEKGGGKTFGYTLQGPAGFSIGSVFRVAVYLAQAGVSLCKDDCTKPYFNDPKAVQVYDFLRKVNKFTPPGLTFNPDEGTQYSQLHKGVSAYQMAGAWHVSWGIENGCTSCAYSDVPLPKDGKPASVIVGNTIYAILKSSKNPELAKQWLTFAIRDDVQSLVFASRQAFPATRSALKALLAMPEKAAAVTNPMDALKTFSVSAATKSYINVLLNSANLQVLPQWRKNPDKVWSAWNEMFTKVLTTDEPIQKILDEGQSAADAASK